MKTSPAIPSMISRLIRRPMTLLTVFACGGSAAAAVVDISGSYNLDAIRNSSGDSGGGMRAFGGVLHAAYFTADTYGTPNIPSSGNLASPTTTYQIGPMVGNNVVGMSLPGSLIEQVFHTDPARTINLLQFDISGLTDPNDDANVGIFAISAVPEPSGGLWVLLGGLLGFLVRRRRV